MSTPWWAGDRPCCRGRLRQTTHLLHANWGDNFQVPLQEVSTSIQNGITRNCNEWKTTSSLPTSSLNSNRHSHSCTCQHGYLAHLNIFLIFLLEALVSRQTGNVWGRRLEFFSDVRKIPFFHSRVRLAYIPIFEEFAKIINRLYENAFRLVMVTRFKIRKYLEGFPIKITHALLSLMAWRCNRFDPR